MNTRELIIETQLQINRLAGNRRFQMLDDLIVWELNNAQDMLIKNALRVDPAGGHRYLSSQVDNAELQRVVKPNYKLTVLKDTNFRGYAYLPPDFGFCINDRSVVVEDCKTEYTNPSVDTRYQIYVIPFIDSVLTASPYYKLLSFQKDSTNLVVNLNGVPSKNQKYEVRDRIAKEIEQFAKTTLNAPTARVYWESFDEFYYTDSFLLVAEIPLVDFQFSIDGQVITKTPYTLDKVKYKDTSYPEIQNRSFKGDGLYDALGTNYYDLPTPDSPVTCIADQKLFVFNSERFIVSGIFMDYVRKPRRISLSLNQSSELDSNSHVKLCSLAAELYIAAKDNDNWKEKVQQNITRT